GKLAKEKLKNQLQKIAMTRTGGQKTDEILGNDGGGPAGVPDSIIVTAAGVEGEAPILPEKELAPPEGVAADEAEPVLPTLAKGKTGPAMKSKTGKIKHQRGAKPESPKQMTLGFEEAKPNVKKEKSGKKHGAKKAKK